MEGKGKISEYRTKLDKTLASSDLTTAETVHKLVKNQISKLGEYNDYVVERRSREVFDFLSELRSASVNDERLKLGDESNKGWKVKQDTHELRVMYREGPEGTPYHSLLCEGYVDGPVDVCMCISYESDLYKKWWPQIVIPTFRVIASQRVQKVRMGEQISVVRMKLSWPMSSREVLVHYFTFEYFQDGLVVVLLKSISDSENVDRSTHGFTRDGIPNPEDVVRMDLFGGFALQKVTPNRSYFRTIANMDIKLDFVPPAIINFIARQLVGSGFKLYKKEVASVSKTGAKFQEALKDPLYTRIHNSLYSGDSEAFKDNSGMENDDSNLDFEDKVIGARDGEVVNEIEEFEDKHSGRPKSLDEGNEIKEFEEKDSGGGPNSLDESTKIEEFEQKDSDGTDSLDEKLCGSFTDKITEEVVRTDRMEVSRTEVKQHHEITKEHSRNDIKTKVGVRPEVLQALETLEKAISMFRECNNNPGKGQSEAVKKESVLNLKDDNGAGEELISSKKSETFVESSKIGSAELASHAPSKSSDNHSSRHKGSNSYTRELNQSKIAPASPDEEGHSSLSQIELHSSTESRLLSTEVAKRKNKKARFCCLSFSS